MAAPSHLIRAAREAVAEAVLETEHKDIVASAPPVSQAIELVEFLESAAPAPVGEIIGAALVELTAYLHLQDQFCVGGDNSHRPLNAHVEGWCKQHGLTPNNDVAWKECL